MNLEKILIFAHTLISKCTKVNDITIDATIGNGNDTLFLANLVGSEGIVYGFDIQDIAINNSKELLKNNNINNVTLFKSGHEHIIDLIPKKNHGQISSAIFNLGYLPKGCKTVTTKGDSTIKAIKQLLKIIKINGIIVLVIYHGHPEGKQEMNEILEFVKSLNQNEASVLEYRFLNQKNNAPFIIAIEKLKQ